MEQREIKFRGISKKTGDFIYGMPTFNFTHIFNDEQIDSPDNYEIIPETLGQFTGLTDKNGVEIYEGDVILSDGGIVADVSFLGNNKTCTIGFYLTTPQGFCALLTPDTGDAVKVIGNIHQNPELL